MRQRTLCVVAPGAEVADEADGGSIILDQLRRENVAVIDLSVGSEIDAVVSEIREMKTQETSGLLPPWRTK